jgi:uncharacterized membrane protein
MLLSLVLMLAYPLLSHVATLAGAPVLQWLALFVLFTAPLTPAIGAGRPWAFVALACLALLIWELAQAGVGQYALFLPPVVLPLALSASFGLTLLPGHTPLITAIALAVHGTLPETLQRYTHRLTLFWSLLTATLSAAALGLAIAGPLWLWSLFTNLLSYLLIAAVFVGEYLLRRRWFPDYPHPGFMDYLGIVARSRPRLGR